jgi:hypothetical protein
MDDRKRLALDHPEMVWQRSQGLFLSSAVSAVQVKEAFIIAHREKIILHSNKLFDYCSTGQLS